MASTSSSSAEVYAYDVFVSFRGEDTRNSFTDHLYHGLKRAGICTFRDTEEINRGEELQPEIERAIKSSRASIVVLSENYATSTWCLDELMLILEQKKQTEGSHSVVPVFYHVDPSDVRKQIGSFDIKVKASTRWTDEKVCLWKTALTEVANLSGFTLSGPETIILKEIVETVYDKLDRKEVHLPLNITGMTSRYKEIESWIDGGIPEFLAIYGMGGSGKTTLAKHIFNLNRRTFEYVSFIEDIGTRCNEPSGLLQLQEQLLKDILGGKKRKISSVSRGTCMIGDALQMNRTLIVLDDILEHNQLVALLGTRKINAQSKVIITTRKNIDNWFDLSCHRCQKYEMKLLNDDESLELLSRHAFRSKIPNEGSMSLLLEATRLCEGNPLALEVLGSSLLTNDATYWESMLKLFGKDIDSRIEGVLKRSYESLPCNTVKQLFLHIACFFTGIDMDYVVKILDPDYSARSGIKTLINRCLLSVSPNKTLMMHRLLQEMGKNIVRQESTNLPARRSRVWLSCDSHKILSKGKGSETIEGLALDMRMLRKEHSSSTSSELKTDALKNMDNLKLLKLNYVELNGSYEKFSEDLKWLCWLGFHSRTIPVDLYMGNLVAIDMSYSNLEVFEPPMDIHTLKILNLKDSYKLIEILNIFRIPNLETLILWNCFGLVNVCKTIEGLTSLTLLNMSGCENLFRGVNLSAASSSGAVVTEQPNFSFPFSLNRLFLNDCHLECTDSFPLSFSVQPVLQYLNLGNSLFESLPCYNHLENLRVLDLSNCSRLRCLVRLPNTLAELYVYYCELLEKITFQSPRFTLQEFGYEGCINLYEVEGFIKLLPIAKLDETDLGHMNWLKVYQNHEMCLGGDDELTVGRSWHIQMLYEFNIMSTSLPNIKDPNMTPKYISKSSSLSFDVPCCPKNKRLKGINVTFKYTISGEDWVWFCKINTRNGVDLIYNPRVFGKPEFGKECIWLSYWPIGNKLSVGDTVHVSVVVFNGLEVHECGVSMVYSDEETLEDNMGWEEIIGGDLSGFQLSTGAYYLCRNDFFELMEVGRVTPDWFRILVGHTINYTEVRGWRKTGRPKQVNPSFTELRTIRCIIHGPQQENIYNIAEMSKSPIVDKSLAFTSTLLEEEMKSIARSDETMGEIYAKQEIKSGLETVGDFISTLDKITIKESDPHSHGYGAVRSGGGEEYPDRPGEPVCQYYMRTGMCKFGASCKYHHPRHGVGSSSTVPLNMSGYPLRPGEKECSYYVKTGQCKFGVTCKFHHPQPTAVIPPPPQGPPPESTPSAIYPSQVAASQPYGVFARSSLLPGSYMPTPYSPVLLPPGMVPFPGWNPYQAPVSPAASPNTVGAAQFYAVTPQLSPPYTGSYLSLPSSSSKKEHSFPERPGEPECQYYLKTGDCKFGSSCRYHHPSEWTVPKSNFVLSPMGLPLRPGAPLCTHYSQKGVCKFGPSCKFDHPMGTLSYSPSASSLADMPVAPYPVGSSIVTLAPSSSSSELRPDLVSSSNKDGLSTSMPSGSASSSLSQSMPVSDSTGGTITRHHST